MHMRRICLLNTINYHLLNWDSAGLKGLIKIVRGDCLYNVQHRYFYSLTTAAVIAVIIDTLMEDWSQITVTSRRVLQIRFILRKYILVGIWKLYAKSLSK